jgi:hypothetical protein
MANLTSQQANELANYFLSMAEDVGDYRYKNFDTLSMSQNKEIKDLLEFIRKCADELFTLSAVLVMDDVQTSLSSIGEVTKQMKGTYKTLQDVQKAINVAAAIVTLGKALLSKNPWQIAESTGNLVECWKAAKN